MTKRIFLVASILLLCMLTLTPAKNVTYVFTIDDFEDGNLTERPEWWSFGEIGIDVIDTSERIFYLGNKALLLAGKSKHWYVGGLGTYLGINAAKYNAIKLVVKGSGKDSGKLLIELYDDDNNNWAIEPHPTEPSSLAYDDKFTYTLDVDWYGWRVVIIPLKKFKDDNPGIGDNKWNPSQTKKSGGLIQMQLVGLGHEKKGKLNIAIDTIKLFRQSKKEY